MNRYLNTRINCKEHISSACLAINKPMQTVKTLFQNCEVTVIDYSNSIEKEIVVEIRLDTATLTCLFDENDICEGVFIFLDDIMNIKHYLEYCNKTYPLYPILSGWIVNNFLVEINLDHKDYNILVLPVA